MTYIERNINGRDQPLQIGEYITYFFFLLMKNTQYKRRDHAHQCH